MVRTVLALLMLFPTTVAFGQAGDLDQAKVRDLVRQLEARGRENRDKAEAELRELGPAVLSLLPEIDARTGGEMKQRLLRIRAHLEEARLSESSKESRVTLEGTMTIAEAFEKIEEQTGNSIVDYRGRLNQNNDDSEITVELKDVPFWEAMDKILDEAGLTFYSFVGESGKLAVVAAGEMAYDRSGKGAYAGLFRVEPTLLTLEKNLRNPEADIFRMNIEMMWEPRVLPILVRQDFEDLEITTDNGDTLEVGSNGTIQLPIQPGVASVDIRLPLSLPSREATKIESLKGRFTALVPGGEVDFEFDDLTAKNVKQRKGGITVIMEQVHQNGGVQQIFVLLRLDQAGESLQSHLDWVENNKVVLIDPAGKVTEEPAGYEQYRSRDSEVGYAYNFAIEGPLDGWKLSYTTPAGIAEVPVEYEIKDVPLP